jgi:hypothetical protein
MLDNPVGDRLVRGYLRGRQRFARCLEHVRLYGVRLFVVEAKTEEAEPDHRAQLTRETAEQCVGIVIGPEGLRYANERLVACEG